MPPASRPRLRTTQLLLMCAHDLSTARIRQERPVRRAAAAESAGSGLFYINQMGSEQGPIDYAQLQQMAIAGQLRAISRQVRRQPASFSPARQVPGLFSNSEWLTTLLLSIFLGNFGWIASTSARPGWAS